MGTCGAGRSRSRAFFVGLAPRQARALTYACRAWPNHHLDTLIERRPRPPLPNARRRPAPAAPGRRLVVQAGRVDVRVVARLQDGHLARQLIETPLQPVDAGRRVDHAPPASEAPRGSRPTSPPSYPPPRESTERHDRRRPRFTETCFSLDLDTEASVSPHRGRSRGRFRCLVAAGRAPRPPARRRVARPDFASSLVILVREAPGQRSSAQRPGPRWPPRRLARSLPALRWRRSASARRARRQPGVASCDATTAGRSRSSVMPRTST